MIENDELAALIRRTIAGARVDVVDRTGTMDHFNVAVHAPEFNGKTVLAQHQMVYSALSEALKDGRVHAVELKTFATEE
ncbi:MAG: BolA/IbaG family iron-sulfur metabolism protein [Candidatus Tyrphobacter sp.]